jgi:phosphate acyltransferase
MRIAIDAMGGDRAPDDVIEGVRLFLSKETDTEIILVGVQDRIKPLCSDLDVTIVDAPTVVDMHDSPSTALKTKRDSSISIATSLVKEGKADALLSMGNSGATVGFAIFVLGRFADISKPGIIAPFPTVDGYTLLLDVGATVDCKPEHLLHFAVMGSIYKKMAFNIPDPKIGLLSIGEEKSKGNELTFNTHKLLKTAPLNYIGNVEGVDIMRGTADVVVCDGFIGNVILKFGEGFAKMFCRAMEIEIEHVFGSEVDSEHRKTFFQETMGRVDYSSYGAALLLGVNGHCLIGHGRSGPKAIANGIRTARTAAQKCPTDQIRHAVEEVAAVVA